MDHLPSMQACKTVPSPPPTDHLGMHPVGSWWATLTGLSIFPSGSGILPFVTYRFHCNDRTICRAVSRRHRRGKKRQLVVQIAQLIGMGIPNGATWCDGWNWREQQHSPNCEASLFTRVLRPCFLAWCKTQPSGYGSGSGSWVSDAC